MGPADGSDNYQIVTGGVKALQLTVTTGTATFSNTETTLNFNPQTSLLASYYYLNFGGGSIMYRNNTDIYFGSNSKYNSAGSVAAIYTSANGMGLLTMDGGNLRFQATDTSVTAGTVYGVPIRFAINGDGNVGIGTATPTNPLQVETTGADLGIQVYRNVSSSGGSAPIFLSHKSTGGVINTTSIEAVGNGAMIFRTGATGLATFGTPRLTIDSGGAATFASSLTVVGFISNNLNNHGEKFISLSGPNSVHTFDVAAQFPSLGITGNVLGVTMILTIFGSGGTVYSAIATIARNSGGTWSSYALTAVTSTASLLQSITGSGTIVTINTSAGSYVGVKVTAITQ
jgi:hypothetical protein